MRTRDTGTVSWVVAPGASVGTQAVRRNETSGSVSQLVGIVVRRVDGNGPAVELRMSAR
jgi:hypothetical protein